MIALPSKKPVVADHEMNPACQLHPVHPSPHCTTALLPIFVGNAICCPPFPVAPCSSTDMHSCCHSFVASLFENAIGCVFENAVGRDGKCVTHPCFSSGAACLSFQRRWQLIVGCMCFGVWYLDTLHQVTPPAYPIKEGCRCCMRFLSAW